ncbi:hypothetical protein Pint_13885 [Pistacia integerrima]|uniref:Uncharacterized protein n=1 Tax=Pistacia integerrima TaxID=434235 RepID=A0ACC0Y957_9ROSI|nr:hypothetical protein Pint_13885 [Pistacia integerrima]
MFLQLHMSQRLVLVINFLVHIVVGFSLQHWRL